MLDMKVALVHDQLQDFGGAERVFLALKKIFPKADVFTSFYKEETLDKWAPDWRKWRLTTSWAAKIPKFGKIYSPLRFLAPWIWESFDLSGYDLVISSSGWYMSKGVLTKPETLHICYLHHNPRYLHGYETALEWQRYWPVRIYAHIVNKRLRTWDFIASQRPDYLVVNSEETKKRAQKFYHRDAHVIYPPVEIPEKVTFGKKADYYLTVARLTTSKHIEVLIRAANKKSFILKIVGGGPNEERLKKIAGPTVEFLGNVTDEELLKTYQGAKAFLFASRDEEFGIAPVEAMGYGVPVIAYASGGLLETVKEDVNGYLFDELEEDSLIEKIEKLESLSPAQYLEMRKNSRQEAEQYSFANFKKHLLNFIDTVSKR